MPGSEISAGLCSTYMYSKTNQINITSVIQPICARDWKNIIAAKVSRLNTIDGGVYITRHVLNAPMRVAGKNILKQPKVGDCSRDV